MRRTQIAAERAGNHAQRAGNYAIRRPCDSDREALREFLGGLSPRASYLRFFTGAPPASQAMLRILAGGAADADPLVAIADNVIIGHAMAADRAGPDGGRRTEIGVVVADAHQGRGVGSALVRQLVARAQLRGVTTVLMEVLAENRQVLAMIEDHWPVALQDRSGAYVTFQAPLQPQARRWAGPEPCLPESAQEPRLPESAREMVAAGSVAKA